MLQKVQLVERVTAENFEGASYLFSNPDVAQAIRDGRFTSAEHHFKLHGRKEERYLRRPASVLDDIKIEKLNRILPHIRISADYRVVNGSLRFIDALSPADEEMDSASTNFYDGYMTDIVERYSDGLVLDCGAGWRPVYYSNTYDLDIHEYDTTDIVAANESLPFNDDVFDAVFSVAVLEHVRDPFGCAAEIVRVLKPGGTLYCCVPFLQPFHGYPSHYYNMTYKGLENLFVEGIDVEKLMVHDSTHPLLAISWILRLWRDDLGGLDRLRFGNLRVKDLIESSDRLAESSVVRNMSEEAKFKLASACVLLGKKKVV